MTTYERYRADVDLLRIAGFTPMQAVTIAKMLSERVMKSDEQIEDEAKETLGKLFEALGKELANGAKNGETNDSDNK